MKHTQQNQPRPKHPWLLSLLLAASLLLSACGSLPDDSGARQDPPVSQEAPAPDSQEAGQPETPSVPEETSEPAPQAELPAPAGPELSEVPFTLADAAPYTSEAYTVVNGNQPYFSEADLTEESYEVYSPLDSLGRCGTAYANIGLDLMPTAEREAIGQVKPTGWHTVKYSGIDGNYLYNRCHLIGYQLSGENANEENLITGTRYLNVQGMLPFENMVADYVKETGNHVLYRVTPVFEGDNLLASGVLMEAESVEDKGEAILFCVYVYNVQPGITIDYATGNSQLAPDTGLASEEAQGAQVPESGQQPAEPGAQEPAAEPEPSQEPAAPPAETVSQEVPQGSTYILNTNTKKFHIPSCSSVKQMKDSNKQEYTGSREDVISMGYDPCKRCYP